MTAFENKEHVYQPELLSGIKVEVPKEIKQTQKKRRKPNRIFQQAVDLVKLRRDKIYNQPVVGENLDGKIVDLTTRSDDDRPVKPVSVKQEQIPVNVPPNVQALSRMIEKGTLGKKKLQKEAESTDFTHQKVSLKVDNGKITGLAHDAWLPQQGETPDWENLRKMAENAKEILKKHK